MERSLSVLLPVHDVQSTLETTVLQWIEVLPEVTRRFDLLIIDDGSTDYTPEVANELAARYPQVRMTRHATRRGLAASLRTGIERSTGEVVLCRDEDCRLEPAFIPRLWERMDRHDVVLARHSGRVTSTWSAWLPEGWHSHRPDPSLCMDDVCLRMMRRRAMESLLGSDLNLSSVFVAEVSSRGCRWHEVHMPAQPGQTPESSATATPRKRVSHRGRVGRIARADQAGSESSQPKGPNYLAKLKDFALGE